MDKDRGIEPYPVTEEIYMVPCTINLSNNEYTPLCKPSGCQIQS